jgi:hypothetical protein
MVFHLKSERPLRSGFPSSLKVSQNRWFGCWKGMGRFPYYQNNPLETGL